MQENFSKELWISVGVVFGSMLVAGGVLAWISGDINTYVAEISRNRLLIEQRTRAVEVLARLKQNEKEVENYQALMNRILPTKEELLDFNRRLQDVAAIYHITVSSAFQDAGTVMPTSEQAGSVGFRFEAIGDYDNILNFYNDIEKNSSKFLVSVDSLDVRGSGGNTLQASSRARVFFH